MGKGDLDAAPLREWIEAKVAEIGQEEALRRVNGLDRQLHRIRNDGQPTVDSGLADRLLAGLGGALWEIYADDGEGLDAWCWRCREIVTANPDGVCPWCEAQTGGVRDAIPNRRGLPTKMRWDVLLRARQMYLRGAVMPDIAKRLVGETDHTNAEAMRVALYRAFKSQGWPTRGRHGPANRPGSTHWAPALERANVAQLRQMVPIAPLREWLWRRLPLYESRIAMARAMGIWHNDLWRMMSAPKETVRKDKARRLLGDERYEELYGTE